MEDPTMTRTSFFCVLISCILGCTVTFDDSWMDDDSACDDDSSDVGDDDTTADDDDTQPADDDTTADDDDVVPDQDGDGYSEQPDCDDSDPDINPGATEICDDGVDNDCDGQTDEQDEECEDLSFVNIWVNYPSTHDYLALNVSPIWDEAELGQPWVETEAVLDYLHVVVEMEGGLFNLKGLALNTVVGEDVDNDGDLDSYDWYCYGHYQTAELDPVVQVGIEIGVGANFEEYEEYDLVSYSPGTASQIELGCMALLWFDASTEFLPGQIQQ
jgi:hypothetical protein